MVAAVAAFLLLREQPSVLSAAQATRTEVPPKGYRYPLEADYRGDWKEFRAIQFQIPTAAQVPTMLSAPSLLSFVIRHHPHFFG